MTVRLLALACCLFACASAGTSNPNTDSGLPPGGDAIPAIDGNNCVNQPCDILTQCGCPAASACDVDTQDLDGPACRQLVGGASPEGGPCSNLSQCAGGTVCLGGFCKKYCSSNTDCGAPRGQCVIDIQNAATMTAIPNVPPVCSSNCDPTSIAAGGCSGTAPRCSIFTQTHMGQMFTIADCLAVTTAGGNGASCKNGANGDDHLCAADFMCITQDGGTSFQCRHACKPPANTGCPGGTTCNSFTQPLVLAGTTIGVCI